MEIASSPSFGRVAKCSISAVLARMQRTCTHCKCVLIAWRPLACHVIPIRIQVDMVTSTRFALLIRWWWPRCQDMRMRVLVWNGCREKFLIEICIIWLLLLASSSCVRPLKLNIWTIRVDRTCCIEHFCRRYHFIIIIHSQTETVFYSSWTMRKWFMVRHGIIPSRTEVERIEINQKRSFFSFFL